MDADLRDFFTSFCGVFTYQRMAINDQRFVSMLSIYEGTGELKFKTVSRCKCIPGGDVSSPKKLLFKFDHDTATKRGKEWRIYKTITYYPS